VGESGALAIYGCIQMLNYGLERNLVAMVADGSAKYASEMRARQILTKKDQVSVAEASSSIGDYGAVVWAHNMFVPKEEGIRSISSSLGCSEESVKIALPQDVQRILNGGDPSAEFERMVQGDRKPILFVCMVGNTSLMLVKVLQRRGVQAQSLMGGIIGLPASRGRQPLELVKAAGR